MLRQRIVYFLFLLLFSGCAEENDGKHTKEYIQEHVFIETDTSSDLYQEIITFDTTTEPYYLELVNRQGGSIKPITGRFRREGLAQNWVRMVQYKGVLYPILHERINGDCLQINDSTVIIPMMEGAWPLNIVGIRKSGDNEFEIAAKELADNGSQEDRFINIEILSHTEGIAKFFFQKPDEKGYYEIMIDANKIGSRPIIVIADSQQRRVASGFSGEPIDLYKLTDRMKKNR